jgi:hypothetical protein
MNQAPHREQTSVHALGEAHQASEASRVLKAALEAADLPQIARLVSTDQSGPGPGCGARAAHAPGRGAAAGGIH